MEYVNLGPVEDLSAQSRRRWICQIYVKHVLYVRSVLLISVLWRASETSSRIDQCEHRLK